jgi:recombination protein RecR
MSHGFADIMYARPIQQLIQAFRNLPSVGERTAERYVFSLLRSGKKEVAELTLALKHLSDTIRSCEICWNFSDKTPCAICSDNKRDKTIVCVVADPQDLEAIEKTRGYAGLYHVLRGVIRADEDDNLRYLKIKELITRIQQNPVAEVILAFNPDVPGETTMMYLEKEMKKNTPEVKITRLARGLPMGSDLQYADEITLGSALKNRLTM